MTLAEANHDSHSQTPQGFFCGGLSSCSKSRHARNTKVSLVNHIFGCTRACSVLEQPRRDYLHNSEHNDEHGRAYQRSPADAVDALHISLRLCLIQINALRICALSSIDIIPNPLTV